LTDIIKVEELIALQKADDPIVRNVTNALG
jgi:hypothetical protein